MAEWKLVTACHRSPQPWNAIKLQLLAGTEGREAGGLCRMGGKTGQVDPLRDRVTLAHHTGSSVEITRKRAWKEVKEAKARARTRKHVTDRREAIER